MKMKWLVLLMLRERKKNVATPSKGYNFFLLFFCYFATVSADFVSATRAQSAEVKNSLRG